MSYSHRVYIGPYLKLSPEINKWIYDIYHNDKRDDPDYETVSTIIEMDFISPEFVDNVLIPYKKKGLINAWTLDENKCRDISLDTTTSEDAIVAFNAVWVVLLSTLRAHGLVEVKYGVVSYVS